MRAEAPLSPQRAQALGRPQAQPTAVAAPVVHLHIDRIDVGAPASPPRTAPSKNGTTGTRRFAVGLPAQGRPRVSTALAIGGVSEALRNFIDSGFVQANLAGAVGAAVDGVGDRARPRRPQRRQRTAPAEHLPLPGPAQHGAEQPRPAQPRHPGPRSLPTSRWPLNLHYLLTAYARSDAAAEMILGTAMQLLHETPRLTAGLLRSLLDPAALPATLLALADTRLADQSELLRITPLAHGLEDLSRLWSALQTPCRPSMCYEVSVVLIEAERATVKALPVLSRGLMNLATGRDRGVAVQADMLPPLPTLFAAAPLLTQQSVARLGDTVRASGVRLNGAGATALLTHRLRPLALELAVTPNAAGTQFDLVLPDDAAAQVDLIPGVWQLSLRVTPPGELNPRETNGVALLICADPVLVATGPPLNLPAATAIRGGAPQRVTVQMLAQPQVRPEQGAVLLLDGMAESAQPRANAASALVFSFPDSLPTGNRWVRLRVDGVESLLVLKTGTAPVFDLSQQLAVP